jgi:hypothetical protein
MESINTTYLVLLDGIVEPISNYALSLKTLEERFYSTFADVSNKIEFLSYLGEEYLPYYKDKLHQYKKLTIDNPDVEYYKILIKFESKKIDFVSKWLKEKRQFFSNLQSIESNSFFESPESLMLIKEFVWHDRIEEFNKITNRFIKFFESKSKEKKELIYFLHYLINKKFFRPRRKGTELRNFHYKQFIAMLFFGNKLALTDSFKKEFAHITTESNHIGTLLEA